MFYGIMSRNDRVVIKVLLGQVFGVLCITYCYGFSGFLLAVLGSTSAIDPIYDAEGHEVISRGTVAAAWQNFFICVEMFFAAVALRYAFSISAYIDPNAGFIHLRIFISTCTLRTI